MLRFTIKVMISALLIAGISEVGKRVSWIAAILASLPVTSILAMTWLYWDTRDPVKVSELSYGILWAVLPSLLFFWVLPLLLKMGMRFPAALPLACLIMFIGYTGYVFLLKRFGINSL